MKKIFYLFAFCAFVTACNNDEDFNEEVQLMQRTEVDMDLDKECANRWDCTKIESRISIEKNDSTKVYNPNILEVK